MIMDDRMKAWLEQHPTPSTEGPPRQITAWQSIPWPLRALIWCVALPFLAGGVFLLLSFVFYAYLNH
jgi:hypothetical protein